MRWKGHRRDLHANTHHSSKLQNHYNKYGINDLVFEFIVICDKDVLIQLEQYFIDLYNPFFNCSPTAGNCAGVRLSAHTREKMSKAKRAMSEETRKKMSEAKKNTSEETKKRMSDGQRRRYGLPPLQSRRAIRIKGRKKPHSERKPFTEETRRRMSVGQMKRFAAMTPEERKRGPFSEETKRKMSIAHKRRILVEEEKGGE